MNNGWITLHRKMLDWEWYDDINVKTLFLHLLLTVNHKDKRWQGEEVKRGQTITSFESLANETGISKQSIRTSLNKLKSTCEITCQSTNRYTLITVINYDTYQTKEELTNKPINKPTNKRATNKQQTTNKQLTTNNNDNKETMKTKEQDIPIKELAAGAEFVLLTKQEKERLIEAARERFGVYDYKKYLGIATKKIDEHLRNTKKVYKSHNGMYYSWGFEAARKEQLIDIKVDNAKQWEGK